jgi:hypothetical protein
MILHDSPSLLEALPGLFQVTLATASRVSRLFKGRDIRSEVLALYLGRASKGDGPDLAAREATATAGPIILRGPRKKSAATSG